jgi:hypothetical protein
LLRLWQTVFTPPEYGVLSDEVNSWHS